MFKPRHFAGRHFAPAHFVGRGVVVIVIPERGPIRGGAAPISQFKELTEQLLREDEEVLMVIMAFVEVNNGIS